MAEAPPVPESVGALAEYAAAAAVVIDRVHAELHQVSAPGFRAVIAGTDLTRPHRGLLLTLRYALPRGPMTRTAVRLALRYHTSEQIEEAVDELARDGWLASDGRRPHGQGTRFLTLVYDVHAEVARRQWGPAERPAAATQRLLDAARESGGPAFAVMSPPYERPGDPSGLLLFNRLAAFRYHRADAHAAAWQAAGLTAEEIVRLGPGERRDRIERETNQNAAAPFAVLGARERGDFLAWLDGLPGPSTS
ncbi:MAG TPA: hypothetical protein VI076_09045 [Actinopolymorphaceae bacterium]